MGNPVLANCKKESLKKDLYTTLLDILKKKLDLIFFIVGYLPE